MMNSWGIETSSLPNQRRYGFTVDQFYENPMKDLLFVVYGINEVRMGWYFGNLAIYTNKQNPKLIINPVELRCFGYSETISFSNDGKFAFINVRASKDNHIELPICIIDLENKSYTFIRIINGNHYQLEEINVGQFLLKNTQVDNRFESFDGKVIDIAKLKKYSIDKLDNFSEIYFNNNECEFEDDGNIS